MKLSAIEQKLENCKLALRLWNERVTPDQVVKELNEWTCETQACFGGWLATWPEFRDMGVFASYVGSPIMVAGSELLDPSLVSNRLFGDRNMFKVRGLGPAGGDEEKAPSAHAAVVLRLETQIDYLTRELEKENTHV